MGGKIGMCIEDIYRQANTISTKNRLNDYSKIKIKCWVCHSESRVRNGNEPFTFQDFSKVLNVNVILEYIDRDLIDVSDIGGKEKAIYIVERWYGIDSITMRSRGLDVDHYGNEIWHITKSKGR